MVYIIMLGVKMSKTKRELTQLISVAKFYLDLAESIDLSATEKELTIQANSETASSSLKATDLNNIDQFFAHIGSASVRMATAHEILAGSVSAAWKDAYPSSGVTDHNIQSARCNGLEILLRDNIAHCEEAADKAKDRAAFRKAALSDMTPEMILSAMTNRYRLIGQQIAAQGHPAGGN